MFIWASCFHSIEEVGSLNKQGLKDDWSSGTCDSFFFSKEKKSGRVRCHRYINTDASVLLNVRDKTASRSVSCHVCSLLVHGKQLNISSCVSLSVLSRQCVCIKLILTS
jgi:hypothetical protein